MLEHIAEWLLKAYRASPRIVVVICIISGLLFFLPAGVLHTVALDDFALHNRTPISLVFWFTLLVTLSYPVELGSRYAVANWRARVFHKNLVARLEALDAEEKEILKSFIHGKRRTQTFALENGAVAALVSSGILFYPIDTADSRQFPTSVADWAWDYLHQHPELLR